MASRLRVEYDRLVLEHRALAERLAEEKRARVEAERLARASAVQADRQRRAKDAVDELLGIVMADRDLALAGLLEARELLRTPLAAWQALPVE